MEWAKLQLMDFVQSLVIADFGVLNHLLYLMRVSERGFQRRIALVLAHLCSADDQRRIFIEHHGLELLIGLLGSSSSKQQLDGAVALCKLANKASALSPIDAAPPSPTPQARKALRALKGLVKIQALVRGYLVRKRAAATLHSMQALFSMR